MSVWWLYLMAFCGVALGVWALLPASTPESSARHPGPSPSMPRGPLGWVRDHWPRWGGRPGAMDLKRDLAALQSPFGLTKPMEAHRHGVASLLALVGKLLPLSGPRTQEVGGWLSYFGSGMTAQEFSGLRILVAIGFTVAAVMLIPDVLRSMPLLGVGMAFLGFLAPDLWLRAQVAARHKIMLRSLPEVIDLLALSMGAGLDFLGALNRVVAAKATSKKKDPLLDELSLVIQEIKFGKRRSEALKSLARRVNLPELSSFVRTLVQADRMGTPIAEVLAAHSEDVRFERYNRAEKAALKAPIKILIPLIFCILPCVAIIVAAPIILQFTRMRLFGK